MKFFKVLTLVGLTLLATNIAYAQTTPPLPIAYSNCSFAWNYNDTDKIIKQFNIFIDSVKVTEVKGNLREVSCSLLKLKEGDRLFEISALATDGRESVKVPYRFTFINKPSKIDPVTNIRIVLTE